MSYGSPTRATPAGCIVVLAGIALMAYAVASGWICYLALQATEVQDKTSLLRFYGTSCAVSFVGGIWLLRYGFRKALDADMSKPDEPPFMR